MAAVRPLKAPLAEREGYRTTMNWDRCLGQRNLGFGSNRAAINELEDRKTGLGDDDPRWYHFGLNRPDDPATPGQPSNVTAAGAGATNVLVIIDGARRANSFNYFKQVMGTDPEPV